MLFYFYKKSNKKFSFNFFNKISFKRVDLLESYCINLEAKSIIKELPFWFSEKTGFSFNSVFDLSNRYPLLKSDLDHLQKICYSSKSCNAFDGKAFYKKCVLCVKKNQSEEKNHLEGLYPN